MSGSDGVSGSVGVSESSIVAPRDRWTYCALAALLAVLWLATLNARPLFNPDEGRYAEIPREMLEGGDWVVPHLDGLAYIEKPPLQYWGTALSYRLLGTSAFAARLYSALAALSTMVLVWWTARRLWNLEAAWRAAAVLSGMFMFVVLGQLLTLDMSLTFYMTLSLVAFLRAQQAAQRAGKPEARTWMIVAWVATGLGVLTKGLVAAAIPAAVLMLYSLYARDFAPWRRLYITWGLPLFLAITVPWHWLAARRLPDFLEFFFVHEHVARYLTPIADRQEPWWFFVVVFLAGSLPWTLPALRVLGGGWRRRTPAAGGTFQTELFLWIWIVFIGVFFSLSDSKLMPYILPAMPALALLVAALPAPALKRDFLFTAILTVVAALSLGLASLDWPRLVASSDRSVYFLPLAKPLRQIALVLLASGAFVLAQRVRDATRAAAFLSVGWCLAWLLLIRAAALVAPIYSGVDLAAALELADRDAPVYSVGTYDQSVTFYLRRTVTLVAYRGELDYGLNKAPGAEITDVAEFLRRWSSPVRAFAVMEKSMFDDFKSRGVPMRLIAQGANRVLVARQ
ncbi:MAG TPA: phospholipid carrier-dependent glycosyltransferase [Steroidobacteraceae bacterium]|nr:phospholipid carrier-dependent glycosyltransferase [Steroidobacteraceae bacterium]